MASGFDICMRDYLSQRIEKTLRAYEADPERIEEDYRIEQHNLAGGYGYRQVLELVQNGADAILEAHETGRSDDAKRIHVRLRESRLYVANTGAPLSKDGLKALLSSHSSPKRGNEIGRFGLGFKSLLRLGGLIDVFTQSSGAIRFDPERCRNELMEMFDVAEAPALRLAWPLDDADYDEQVLVEMAWAETVVRAEVQNPNIEQHIRQEISGFPVGFLLFFRVDVQLLLEDGSEKPRELRVERLESEKDMRVLHDGFSTTKWLVAAREAKITDQRALDDATEIHRRESVPLSWAIPLESKQQAAGMFWTFFPTSTPSHLAGILNAPWKVNSDRTAIIPGEWNWALMREAATLVVETLPKMSSPDDPGRPLDAFPRQLDRNKDDLAATLLTAVWLALETAAVIPDGTRAARRGCELWRHPRDNADLARQWEALAAPEELAATVHSSCLEGDRRSRLEALAGRLEPARLSKPTSPQLRRLDVPAWFEAVASTEPKTAKRVLELAKAFKGDCKQWEWDNERPRLRIILSMDNRLLTADEAVLAPGGVNIPGRTPVATTISDDADAKRILLEVMKVAEPDDHFWQSELSRALDKAEREKGGQHHDPAWLGFWQRLRSAPDAVRVDFIGKNAMRIRVQRRDGAWTWPEAALVAGGLVDESDASSNANVLVDCRIHEGDEASLEALGVVDRPTGTIDANGDEGALRPWRDWCRDTYKRQHARGAQRKYLEPSEFCMPSGWTLLPELSGRANAELTEAFVSFLGQEEFVCMIDFGHSTKTTYARIEVVHPLAWFLLASGTVLVGGTSIPLRAVVARYDRRALTALAGWERLSPYLERLAATDTTSVVTDHEIHELWMSLINEPAVPSALADGSLRELWHGAAEDGVVPDLLCLESGDVPLEEMYVTSSPDLARRASKAACVAVTLDPDTRELWLARGAKDLSRRVKPEWSERLERAYLVNAFPELAAGGILRQEAVATARCQPVSGLQMRIGDSLESLPCVMWEGELFADNEQLRALSRTARLDVLLEAAAAADWLQCSRAEALKILGDSQVEKRRAEVAAAASLAERLLLAVGGHGEPLKQALGVVGCADFVEDCTPLQLAELTLAQLGPAALPAVRDALVDEGLNPPSRWGGPEARAFVASIAFPDAFADSPEARREAEESISGPIYLGPLHDFQDDVLEGVRGLIASGRGRRRAVISLPTGAGKTRVTVEAAVRLVLKPEGDRRSVLWIAQTDELCEQAVQAFRQVWINLGAESTDLRIVRLWRGNPNPVMRELDRPVVVVASIQTLNSRMGEDPLGWLQKPGLVVVDECHHAITPSYTRLLRWLDTDSTIKDAAQADQPPILGLSATPFRTDEEETASLAKRFDSRLLPVDQEELHSRLRSQGVLATPEYVPLQSGASLLAEEIEQLAQLQDSWSGVVFENLLEAINQRLANSQERNQKLVKYIQECSERSILFFSNSVTHAGEISARLNLAGIAAAAVSGETPAAARRYFLDRFRHHEIRVLCNHSVLSTGFDAPKTDMVLIARQVFSPVRYMQMVGRGLRGEKNGGKEKCLIVTVLDNLDRFEERHPYHYCRRYFNDGRHDTLQ